MIACLEEMFYHLAVYVICCLDNHLGQHPWVSIHRRVYTRVYLQRWKLNCFITFQIKKSLNCVKSRVGTRLFLNSVSNRDPYGREKVISEFATSLPHLRTLWVWMSCPLLTLGSRSASAAYRRSENAAWSWRDHPSLSFILISLCAVLHYLNAWNRLPTYIQSGDQQRSLRKTLFAFLNFRDRRVLQKSCYNLQSFDYQVPVTSNTFLPVVE